MAESIDGQKKLSLLHRYLNRLTKKAFPSFEHRLILTSVIILWLFNLCCDSCIRFGSFASVLGRCSSVVTLRLCLSSWICSSYDTSRPLLLHNIKLIRKTTQSIKSHKEIVIICKIKGTEKNLSRGSGEGPADCPFLKH